MPASHPLVLNLLGICHCFCHQIGSNSWHNAFHCAALFMSHGVSLWVEMNGLQANTGPIPHCLFTRTLSFPPTLAFVSPPQSAFMLINSFIHIYIHVQTHTHHNMLSCWVVLRCITLSVLQSHDPWCYTALSPEQANNESTVSTFSFFFSFSLMFSHLTVFIFILI